MTQLRRVMWHNIMWNNIAGKKKVLVIIMVSHGTRMPVSCPMIFDPSPTPNLPPYTDLVSQQTYKQWMRTACSSQITTNNIKQQIYQPVCSWGNFCHFILLIKWSDSHCSGRRPPAAAVVSWETAETACITSTFSTTIRVYLEGL